LLGVVYSHENFVVYPVFDIVGYFKCKSAVSSPVFAPVFTVDKKVGYAVDAFEI
jgi:putative methionine-R-sulfoxide reductase with GAF domain